MVFIHHAVSLIHSSVHALSVLSLSLYALSRFFPFLDPPDTLAFPDLTIINQTNTTNFTCQVFGIPIPNITWIKYQDGSLELVEGTDDPNITTTIDGYLVTSVLTFDNPLRTEEAIYECTGDNGVTNVINVPESVNVTLFVQGM